MQKFALTSITILIPLAILAFWTLFSLCISNINVASAWPRATQLVISLAVASVYLAFLCQPIAWFIRLERGAGKSFGKTRLIAIATTGLIQVALFIYARISGEAGDAVSILSSVNLAVFAIFVGTAIAIPLKRAPELVPVCVVMALADLFSVVGGPTKEIVKEVSKYYEQGMTGKVPFGDFLLLKIAFPGQEGLYPLIGAADIVMLAFLCSSALKFGIEDNLVGIGLEKWIKSGGAFLYFPIGLAGLLLALILAQITGVPIPALVLLSAVFLGYVLIRHPNARNLAQSDVKVTLIFTVVLLALLAFRYFGY